MQAPALDRERLRELARLRSGDGVGLSLFLDLDPERFATPPSRRSQITSLLDQAHRSAEGMELEHNQRMTIRRRIEEAREALADGSLFERAHGLGLFIGFNGQRAIRLPAVLAPEVSIDEMPLIRPLLPAEAEDRWCVVLVSRTNGRFLTGDERALSERIDVRDDVHGKHDQGGWSQARYQRSVEEEFRRHLDRVAGVALRLHESERFDQLLIGGTEENASALLDQLDSPLSSIYAGRFAVEVDDAGPDEVLKLASARMEEHRGEALARLRAELQEALGTGGPAVAGLEPTLEAINERRVRELLAAREIDSPGGRCPRCDLLSTAQTSTCPLDGSPLAQRARILDDAIRKAIGDSAEVRLLQTAAEAPSGIAALTHY